MREYHHKIECMSSLPLPTGDGYWGCDCGLDKLLLELEDYEAQSASPAPAPAPDDPLSRLRARWPAVLERAKALGVDDPVQEMIDLFAQAPREPETDDLRERVAALAGAFTGAAERCTIDDLGRKSAFLACASELRALLDAHAPEPQPSGPQGPER